MKTMKRHKVALQSLCAIIFSVLLAACETETIIDYSSSTEQANITLSVATESLSTRFAGDGGKVTDLKYGIYRCDDDGYTLVQTSTIENALTAGVGEFTFSVSLGYSYKIVIVAMSAACPHVVAFDSDGATLTTDLAYSKDDYYSSVNNRFELVGNNEDRDLFYTTLSTAEVIGDLTLDANLYRPFAQLNIGTDDMEDLSCGADPETVTYEVVVKGSFPAVMNLITGAVTSRLSKNIAFIATGLPAESPVMPDGVVPLATNYILAEASSTEETLKYYSVTFSAYDDEMEFVTLSGITAHFLKNYKTNIYGSIFSDVDFTNSLIIVNETLSVTDDNDYGIIWQSPERR